MLNEDFESKIRRQVERLSGSALRDIEREVAGKRIAWCQQNPLPAGSGTAITPRQAFERLFFDYMGLAPEDLPIVCESGAEIAWWSGNPCPTLEACKKLGLDTRRVCRAAYEKSTQAFISQLDPQLRFLRSYQEIRPFADHCLEWITRVDFARMMYLAIEEALIGKDEGYTPGGAIMLLGKNVLGLAHDTTTDVEHDPALHAEAHVIYQAVQTAADSNLSGAILFATREPCADCAALAIRANITTIVYGVSLAETRLLVGLKHPENAAEVPGAQAVIARSPVMIEMIGGVLADRCRLLYE